MTDSNGNKTYTVIFNNGQTINVTADKVEWYKGEGIVCFLYMDACVAQFLINSIAGWVDPIYLAFTQTIYKAI